VSHLVISDSELKTVERKKIISDLVEIGIARRTGTGQTVPASELFKFPSQDNSPKDLVAPANDVIVKHLTTFLAREGSVGEQELGFSFQTCLKSDAEKILQQLKRFLALGEKGRNV
jgi:hypothetical protein